MGGSIGLDFLFCRFAYFGGMLFLFFNKVNGKAKVTSDSQLYFITPIKPIYSYNYKNVTSKSLNCEYF